MGRIRLAIGVLAAGALLSACGLMSFLYPPVDYLPNGSLLYSFDSSEFPFPSDVSEPPVTNLRHGTATIRITSGEPRTVELTHLSGDEPSMVIGTDDAIVAWRTGDWALHIESGSGIGELSDHVLTLVREDTDPPLQADGSSCTVTFTAMTEKHFAGHATCTGLAWTDVGFAMDMPRPSGSAATNHPLFDATITFDATP